MVHSALYVFHFFHWHRRKVNSLRGFVNWSDVIASYVVQEPKYLGDSFLYFNFKQKTVSTNNGFNHRLRKPNEGKNLKKI